MRHFTSFMMAMFMSVAAMSQPCVRTPVSDTVDARRSPLLIRTLDSISTFARPETIFMLSTDGRQALVVGPYGPKGERRLGVARRRSAADVFTTLEPVSIRDVDRSSISVDATMTDDARTLIVAFERASGMGDLDLYVTHRCYDQWSDPQPLGGSINTRGMEGAPTLSKDGRTLYFTSNGRADTRGKADLYMVRRLGDGWTSWTEPTHLGPCVNTTDDELGIEPIGDGTRAIVASYDAQRAGPSNVEVAIPSAAWPIPYCLFHGTVIDELSGSVIAGMPLEVMDSTDGRPCGPSVLESGPDGSFRIALPMRSRYVVRPQREGFAAVDNVLRIRTLDSISPLRLNLRVFDTRRPLVSIVLEGGATTLSERDRAALRTMIEAYGRRSIGFDVVTYVDGTMRDRGSVTDANDRGRVVREAMVRLGIDGARITQQRRTIDMPLLLLPLKEHPTVRRVDIMAAPIEPSGGTITTAPSR